MVLLMRCPNYVSSEQRFVTDLEAVILLTACSRNSSGTTFVAYLTAGCQKCKCTVIAITKWHCCSSSSNLHEQICSFCADYDASYVSNGNPPHYYKNPYVRNFFCMLKTAVLLLSVYASDANKARSYSVTCRQRKVSTGEKLKYVQTSKTSLRTEKKKNVSRL